MKNLDLTNKEDLNTFNESINELKNNSLFNLLMTISGENTESVLDSIKDLGNSIYENAHKDDNKKEVERPSEKVSTEQGLQIHKLVAEYVDTIIKPNSNFNTQTLNDIYAGLYEFACWIINK